MTARHCSLGIQGLAFHSKCPFILPASILLVYWTITGQTGFLVDRSRMQAELEVNIPHIVGLDIYSSHLPLAL